MANVPDRASTYNVVNGRLISRSVELLRRNGPNAQIKLPLVLTVVGSTLTIPGAEREDDDVYEARFGKCEEPQTLEIGTEQAADQKRSENKIEMLRRDAIMKACWKGRRFIDARAVWKYGSGRSQSRNGASSEQAIESMIDSIWH
jgi:hypothetical protein